jgi:hypothetical protein
MTEIEVARKEAYSVQSRPGFNPRFPASGLERIGEEVSKGWKYEYFRDPEGRYWFQTLVPSEAGFIPISEKVRQDRISRKTERVKRCLKGA